MADLQSQIIVSQQKQIAELKAANHQLQQDNDYIKKVLYIALRDKYKGTPLVISDDRLAEATTEFSMDENLSGDHLLWVRRREP